jgi:hypothetical protein
MTAMRLAQGKTVGNGEAFESPARYVDIENGPAHNLSQPMMPSYEQARLKRLGNYPVANPIPTPKVTEPKGHQNVLSVQVFFERIIYTLLVMLLESGYQRVNSHASCP